VTQELRVGPGNGDAVRELEKGSIRRFVASCAEQLSGVVLDFGSGKEPYREIVEAAGGEYHAFDRIAFPANVSGLDVGYMRHQADCVDAILCTQVAQYLPTPWRTFAYLYGLIRTGGHLVMTYPTTWPEVEPGDLWRFTKAGMERLLEIADFQIVRHEERAAIDLGGFRLPLGYGVLCAV
jgi:hypothetical protein